MEKPKTKQVTIDLKDINSAALRPEVLAQGLKIVYRHRPRHRYTYYSHSNSYSRSNSTVVHLGAESTIVGTLQGNVSIDNLPIILAWINKNCSWHRTVVSYSKPKQVVLGPGESPTVPTFGSAWVDSTVHRNITDAMQADLDAIEAAKSERKKKERQVAKERKAKADAERRAQEKKAQEREAGTEFTDLATALKTLKKHGLKIVTVEEKKK